MVEVLNVLSADNHVTVFNLKVRALQQHCSMILLLCREIIFIPVVPV